MKKIYPLLFLIVCFFCCKAQIPSNKEELTSQIAQLADSLYRNSDVPGFSLALVLPDKQVITLSKGFSDTEKKVPMLTEHKLLAGSIGKTIVAATALKLVEMKILQLEKTVDIFFANEEWIDSLPNAKKITVRQLLNHTSGIPEHVEMKKFLDDLKKTPLQNRQPLELIRYAFGKSLFAPGSDWSYADTNYILLGMILEKITGKKFYDLAKEFFLKPYDFNEIIPSDKTQLNKVAVGYSSKNGPFGIDGPVIVNGMFVLNPQLEWTGGGFATTSAALAKWAKMLFEGSLLGNEIMQEMYKGVPSKLGKNLYGLGVIIGESTLGKCYWHSGWFPGYLSEVRYFKEYGFSLAIQFNTDEMNRLGSFQKFTKPIALKVVEYLKKKG